LEKKIINVFNIVGNSYCVDANDGQKVFALISKTFKENKNVELSFQNIDMSTAAFLNSAIGQLYRDFDEMEIVNRLIVVDMSEEDKNLLKRVISSAKIYYKNPEKMEQSIKEILAE